MRRRCGNANPEKHDVECNRPSRLHPVCSGWDEETGDYLDWPNPHYTEAKAADIDDARATARELASKATGRPAEGLKRSWTKGEQSVVRAAIVVLAEERDTFTADDIWDLIDDDVPKGNGLTALLNEAHRDRYIEPTDRYADSQRRDRSDHDQGRRLRVWRSLCRE